MARLMWIAGILLVAAGVALGLMIYFSPTSIVSWGVTPDTAVTLLVGGILALGLGSVVDGIDVVAASRPAIVSAEPTYMPAPIPEFGRNAADAPIAAAAANDAVSPQVKETIEALEQAKQELKQAFDEKRVEEAPEEPAEPEPVAEVVAEEVVAEAEEEVVEEEAPGEGQLYVVEERTIRSRPARILSDGTVEAETDEGWMRFENLEHLDEYLDAMAPTGKA